MEFFSRHKMIIFASAIVAGGFFWYGSSSQTPGNLLTTESGGSVNSSESRDLVETLLTLRAVSLSGTILNDPSFLRLKDFSTPVTLEDVGRADPFSPLPKVAPQPLSAGDDVNQLFRAGRP